MSEENLNQEEGQHQNQPEEQQEDNQPEEESGGINALALLSYLWILFLVPLLAAKDDEFAQFHAKQGLVLFIFWVAIWIASIPLLIIPILGWLVILVAYIAAFVFFIMGIVNVLKGKKKELPVIGKFAKKFNL